MPKLDVSTGVLSVVETNMFKQLTHISLQLRPGNDAAIKGYLASRLSLSLSTNRRLAEELLVKSSALSIVEVEKSEVAAELQEIRSHKDVEEKSIRSQHTQEVSQMQITMLSNMEQMREKYEAQLESARNNIDSLQAAAKVKAEEVLKLTTDLQHEKGHLEFRERELVRLLESADNDRDRIAQECKDIAAQKRAVDEQRGNLERDLARATARIEALTQQVQDRDEVRHIHPSPHLHSSSLPRFFLLSDLTSPPHHHHHYTFPLKQMMVKQMAVQRAGDDARKVLQDKLDMYITNGEALQEKLRESAAEMTRGNALITRLQSEVKQLREKSKAKSEVVARQEDVIQELRSKVNELERQSLFEKDATLLAKTQGEVLKKQLDEANSRIEESAKLISSNQDVIAYLNEEINKWQLGLRSGAEVTALGGGVSGSSSASNAATYNVVSYSPDTTHAVSGDASSSAHQFDKDVYLRGIKNLGLGDSFMVGGTSGITSVGDLGLESFEYYASAEPLYAADTAAQTRHSRSNKAAKQYAWQAEDFGLDQE